MKDNQKNYVENLSPEEFEQFLTPLINEKFNHEKRASWSQSLAVNYGVNRAENRPGNRRRIILWISGIAAAIALLIILAPWKAGGPGSEISTLNSSNYLTLTDHYLEASPFPNMVLRKGVPETEELRLIMAEAYSRADYHRAIQVGDQLISANTSTAEDFFYYSLSHLYAGNYSKAVEGLLRTKQQSASGTFGQEINWFLSLAYIKQDEVQKARETLAAIGEDHWKYKEARQLLKSMP